jgi:pyruvate/2-oxoglutarate dehydrogenase complex dihydrolipoamide acyltransferase (E2) component
MRRAIGQHLTAAAQVPTVTVVEDADLTAVDDAREVGGLSYLPYIVSAVVAGLREVPHLNAQMGTGAHELHVFDSIHAGIAVQTEGGLVVPVLRDAHLLDLNQIEEQVEILAKRAREGKLTPADTRGGTFTVTSAGKYGGLFTNPLLNVPEVGIFGLHRAELRPVVEAGEVVVRRRANVSVTFDHRAIDGIDASRFLLTVVAALTAAK